MFSTIKKSIQSIFSLVTRRPKVGLSGNTNDDTPGEELYVPFNSYFHEFTMNDEPYIIRFMIPSNWNSDSNSAAEFSANAILVDGVDLNSANISLSLRFVTGEGSESKNISEIMSDFEESYIELGNKKNVLFSELKTLDERDLIVLDFDNTELGYCRKEVFFPLREDSSVMVLMGLQVNEPNNALWEEKTEILKLIIQTLKISPENEDINYINKPQLNVIIEQILHSRFDTTHGYSPVYYPHLLSIT